jgi:hypothetical protein
VHLHAALTDLAPLEVHAEHALPRLPALERMLARASRAAAEGDWRRWALAVAGLAAPAGDLPVGATLAAAHGLDASSGTWLVAAPVHFVATPTHVRLHAAGVLAPGREAATALAARFNEALGSREQRLRAVASLLLLQVDGALAVGSEDPDALAGRDVGGALPTGPDGGRVRRLMTEAQMWLHDAPPAGAGPQVNGLWFWGAGRAPLEGEAVWPALDSSDPFLRAAREVYAGRAAGAGARLASWRLADFAPDAAPLARAEAHWFEPLEEELAAGTLQSATIHYGGQVFRLHRRQRWRLWVRPRPWWELVA